MAAAYPSDEKPMEETARGALETFTAAATAAAELGCELRFRQAAWDFMVQLKPKVTCTSMHPSSLEARKHASLQQSRLWRLLRHLPSPERRMFIAERLSEAERLQLEHWILAERARQGSRGPSLPSGFSLRSLCRWKGRQRCRVGYRPILHLHDSLYAQASFTFNLPTAVRAFGMLLAMRCAAEEALTVEKLQSAIAAVQRVGASQVFYFKTRVKLTCRREVATPGRRSLAVALKEWHHAQMLRAQAAVVTGRADRLTREVLEFCQKQKMGGVPEWLKDKTRKRSRTL